MSLWRCYCWCAGILLVLCVSAYATAAGESALAAAALPTIALCWWLSSRAGPGHGLRLPRRFVNLALALAVIYTAVRTAGRIEVASIASLAIILLIVKTLDRRTPRDDAQLLALGLFLAIAAMLDSNRLSVGVQLIAIVPLLVLTIMLFQLHPAWWIVPEARAPGPSPVRSLVRTAAISASGVVFAAIAVFLIMPRGLGQNAFGSWGQPLAGSVTGFTDTVDLGRRNVISESPEIVMDVQFRQGSMGSMDEASIVGSESETYYLRGAVLDDYRDGRWTSTNPIRASTRASRRELDRGEQDWILRPRPGFTPTGPILEQVCTFRNAAARDAIVPIFNVWRPLYTETDQASSRIVDNERLVMGVQRHETGPLQYKIVSALAEEPGEPRPSYRVARLDNPRIVELARQIIADARQSPDPIERGPVEDSAVCRVISDWLRSSCTYTLEEEPVPLGADPIEHFLFKTRRGHCEYFASAMAAMCRAVGVHARVVTGYIAAEWNPSSMSYIVRQSNAHAWVEAGRDRWRRYDPTPPAEIARLHRPSGTILARLWRSLDAVEYAWNRSVVSFDEGRRRGILGVGRLGEWQSQWMNGVSNWMQRQRYARGAWQRSLRGSAVVALVALAGAGALALLRRPRARVRAEVSTASPPMERLYRDTLRTLARSGQAKPSSRSPIDHADAMPRTPLTDAVRDVALAYYRDRFGARATTPAEIAALRSLVRAASRARS